MGAKDFQQADRLIRIEELPQCDQLLVEKLDISEGVSQLFEIRIDALSKVPDLDPNELLGQFATVNLVEQNGRRVWHGFLIELDAGQEVYPGLYRQELLLVPHLWRLSQKTDCRIWQNLDAVEVCRKLCSEHGVDAPDTAAVSNSPQKNHYSVQYNESDLDYMIRRLEADGIFYWFEHSNSGHQLHLADSSSAYIRNSDTPLSVGKSRHDCIKVIKNRHRYTPGKVSARDWNFETPTTTPDSMINSLIDLRENNSLDRYEYPSICGYGDGERASEGIIASAVERNSRIRMQSIEASHQRLQGESSERSLAPANVYHFIDREKNKAPLQPHVMTSVKHSIEDRSYGLGLEVEKKSKNKASEKDFEYLNSFVALPADVVATPSMTKRKPKIDSAQVAIIAGPDGEEIHTDEYGRVKVWFPWDRQAKKDGSDGCWLRVSQNWAGSGWGGQVIPRIGMEVIVSFLEGDPDRPAVIGVVPNKRQKTPYALPKNKTKSVFRTNTHKGKGFNELSFEDKQGKETIYMHAQRDQNIHVENCRAKRVDVNQTESVGNNKTIEVGNNHYEVVGGNMTLMIGPNKLQQAVTAKFKAFTDKLGDFSGKLGVPSALNMGEGNLIVGVAKNKAETVMISSNEIVGGAKTLTVGAGYQVSVAGIKNESVLLGSYEEVGQNKVVVAGKRMEFVCGKSKIQLDEDGTITIEGVTVNMIGSSKINLN